MKIMRSLVALLLFVLPMAVAPALAHEGSGLPKNPKVYTLITTPLIIEGLTGDNHGNLYVPGRKLPGSTDPCPVWRVNLDHPELVVVGIIPGPCAPLGLTFDRRGMLYVTRGNEIYRFFPDADSPPTAEVFAENVPGTNGVVFDDRGNLWTSDGTTGQGRVWRIDRNGTPEEKFRIQPMANEVNLAPSSDPDVKGVGGVGRDVRTLPPGKITVKEASRGATDNAGSQPLVANGLVFDGDGNLIVADTARGALWKVKLGRHGKVKSSMGCDTTFTEDTLCLENVLVAHPLLEGADGIAMDRDGNIWVDANERNALVVVTKDLKVIEVFRNPPDPVTQLRNAGPFEFNTSPVLIDGRFCTANLDSAAPRRDNGPADAGEIGGGDPDLLGKISCIDLHPHKKKAPWSNSHSPFKFTH